MTGTVVLFVSLVLCVNAATAADRLTDVQMDRVTAGQLLGIECSVCTLSSSTSMSVNGVTMTTSSSGGSSTGATGTGGGGGGPPGVGTTVSVPANLAAILKTATTITGGP
jgi:hypothetical protein